MQSYGPGLGYTGMRLRCHLCLVLELWSFSSAILNQPKHFKGPLYAALDREELELFQDVLLHQVSEHFTKVT